MEVEDGEDVTTYEISMSRLLRLRVAGEAFSEV